MNISFTQKEIVLLEQAITSLDDGMTSSLLLEDFEVWVSLSKKIKLKRLGL